MSRLFANLSGSVRLAIAVLTMDQQPLVRKFLESQSSILGFIGALTRDLEVAEEVFQETGVRVVQQARRGVHVEHFLPWVREIARNLVADHYRARSKTASIHAVPESLATVIGQAFEENAVAPENDRSERVALKECVSRLSTRMKEVLDRRYRSCMSLEAIASTIGWTVNSLKVALSRTRKSLLECIRAKARQAEVGLHE